MAAPTNDERSLFTLIGELPDTVSTLVRAEIDQIKAEISYKIKHFGIGSGFVAGAATVGVFLLFTLIRVGRPGPDHRRAALDRLHQLQAGLGAARVDRQPEGRSRRAEGNG
jgi:hypothetical protein